jgi:hypothetical protein
MTNFKKSPENLLYMMAFIMPLKFSIWQALLNNYVVEIAALTGKEIGLLQSAREIKLHSIITFIHIDVYSCCGTV